MTLTLHIKYPQCILEIRCPILACMYIVYGFRYTIILTGVFMIHHVHEMLAVRLLDLGAALS